MSYTNRTMLAVVAAALVVGLGLAGGFAGAISPAQNEQSNYDPTTPDISFIALCSDTSLGETSVTQQFTEVGDGEYKLWHVEFTGNVDYVVLKFGTNTLKITEGLDDGKVSVFDAGESVNLNGCEEGDDEDKYEREGEPPNSELVLEVEDEEA